MSARTIEIEAGGVLVTVRGSQLSKLTSTALGQLAEDEVAGRLAAQDNSLWGADARDEAARRLGWLTLADRSRTQSSWDLLPRLESLRAELRHEGLDRVVLAGMGGSSLASEVIARTAGGHLVVLDTTDPAAVRRALEELAHTIVLVSSKSGVTVEPDSHRRAFETAFRNAGIDPDSRMIAVTDAGSPLEEVARAGNWREVFLGAPNVGGRYSALSASGLVPAALAGVDVAGLLEDAIEASQVLGGVEENPALLLGAALGAAGQAGRDKVVISDFGSAEPGFADWVEQLVAESTGKAGAGLLPVVVDGVTSPGFVDSPDSHLLTLGKQLERESTSCGGSLGSQFLVWEYATAVAARMLGVNPFDQPNVAESKVNAARILDQAGSGRMPVTTPAFVEGPVEVHGPTAVLDGASGLVGVLASIVRAVPDYGYLAVMAYLDREDDELIHQLQSNLARHCRRPVTFGWGPQLLHSCGQYHMGGPPNGAFLQITGAAAHDVDIPGRPFSFGRLQLAQALGDLRALEGRGRPVVRLHLRDRGLGVRALLVAADTLKG